MLCWNNLHPHSEIILIYANGTEITEPKKWLCEKNVLHCIKKLDASDYTVEFLKKITEDAQFSIQDLWDIPIGNDEWIKKNINVIKSPIFIKQNDISIFTPSGTSIYEFIQIGFNKDILAEKLHLL